MVATRTWILGGLCAVGCAATPANSQAARPPTPRATTEGVATPAAVSPSAKTRSGVSVEVRSKRAAPQTVVVSTGWSVPRGPSHWTQSVRHQVHAFPFRVSCPLGAQCEVTLSTKDARVTAELFALDPEATIVVDLDAPARDRVRYGNSPSASAAMGDVRSAATMLADACAGRNALVQATAHRRLEQLTRDSRPLVRDAARLAWLSVRCPDNEPKTEQARVLRAQVSIDPVALSHWPLGAASVPSLVENSDDWLVDLADAHPDPPTGASMLWGYGHDRMLRRDFDTARTMLDALEQPRYAKLGTHASLWTMVHANDRMLVGPGQPLPPLRGTAVGSRTHIDTAAMRGRPVLLYLTSLSCGSCKHNLPTLRRLADAYPEIQIVVVPLDEATGAAAKLAKRYAPVPGVVVQNTPELNEFVTDALMHPHMYPTYVFADAAGTVRATSQQASLDELPALLADAPPAS